MYGSTIQKGAYSDRRIYAVETRRYVRFTDLRLKSQKEYISTSPCATFYMQTYQTRYGGSAVDVFHSVH